jgi:cation diffusion facilitator family transporter
MQNFAENGYKLKSLKLSAIAILSVVIMEVFLGLIVGSLAILSDGVHALLDTLATFTLFIATRVSLKPPDEEHMYGHEKFESIGGLLGGIVLIGVALLIIVSAVLRVLENKSYINQELELAGFIAIGYTFCVDFFRVGMFRKAKNSESATFKAGLYHAIADLSSTVIALLGFGLATQGIYNGDSFASIILGFLLIYLSIKLVWSSGMELSDAVSKDLAEKVRREILCVEGVQRCENLRVRKVGSKTFVEATVQVPEHMNLEEAHNLASKIEANIKNSLGNVDTAIHIEPSEKETRIKKLIEKLATDVEGVKEAHEIAAVFTNDKLYVTLHAYVSSKLSVQEAHEIAEKIENKIKENIINIENVTVHIEPFNIKLKKELASNDEKVNRIIQKTAETCQGNFRVKRIVTYVADEKRYINIDCSFTQQISIENAHRIASQIEDNIKEHFPETIVTIHMEPN